MKKQLLFIIALLAMVFVTSCDDDNDKSYDEQWKINNEAQFAKITQDPEYKRINSQSTVGYIMYKELVSGDGETPKFTDRVKLLYTGWYKYDWNKPDVYKDDKGQTITNKVVFDTTNSGNGIPRTSTVRGFVDGFSTALQHMQVGDKWEIWIPWNLGYGASSTNSIPGYTTLVFEIELVDILTD